MPFNPEVTVAAIVERDARYLLVEERIAGRLVLNQPAGHLEDRETLLAAVVREAREETAWHFVPAALVGTYLWRNPDTGRTFLRFAFCGTVEDFRADQPLDTGIVRAVWLSREQILNQQTRLRSPLVLRCIDDYLLGRRQSLDSVAALDLESAPRVLSVVNL
jgi:8-oxo-dGTP pyrophosphatase MutT (NUDIX family)